MLADPTWITDPRNIHVIINELNPTPITRIALGVYIGPLNLNQQVSNKARRKNPLEWDDFEYGVCDIYPQITERYPEIRTSNTPYVITLTPLTRKDEPASGGWRWHKWGEYIGTQTPTCEYLHDEPEIEKIYVFHVTELY